MILYSLRCSRNHEFDGWFKDSAAYEEQAKARQVLCPHCGSQDVEKAVMAPRIGKARESKQVAAASPAAAATGAEAKVASASGRPAAELRQQLMALRRHIESSCDYVGPAFAEEARRIHYGETEARGIYGETSETEAEGLAEEGINVTRVPWISREDA